MKNLRYILIGFVIGGAFGAKVGSYLSKIWEVSEASGLIEAGFTSGALVGIVSTATYVLVNILAASESESSDGYSAKAILGS